MLCTYKLSCYYFIVKNVFKITQMKYVEQLFFIELTFCIKII